MRPSQKSSARCYRAATSLPRQCAASPPTSSSRSPPTSANGEGPRAQRTFPRPTTPRSATLIDQGLRVVARPEDDARNSIALWRVLHVDGQELARLALVGGEDLGRQRLRQGLAGVALDDELVVSLGLWIRR